jgi:hypothetical protein
VRRFNDLRFGFNWRCWRGGWLTRRTFSTLTSATITALLAVGALGTFATLLAFWTRCSGFAFQRARLGF